VAPAVPCSERCTSSLTESTQGSTTSQMSSASKGNVSLALKRLRAAPVEGRALNPRNAGRELVAPTSKPAGEQGVRVLPPRYVALSKSQKKEAAVAALTELILANMRRLEKVRPAGRKNVTSRK
jgi:hypothetical protein